MAASGRKVTTASAPERAVLGAAEGEDVDPGRLTERTEVDAEGGRGVGDPGTVEVDQHSLGMGPLGQRRQLLDGVDGARPRCSG